MVRRCGYIRVLYMSFNHFNRHFPPRCPKVKREHARTPRYATQCHDRRCSYHRTFFFLWLTPLTFLFVSLPAFGAKPLTSCSSNHSSRIASCTTSVAERRPEDGRACGSSKLCSLVNACSNCKAFFNVGPDAATLLGHLLGESNCSNSLCRTKCSQTRLVCG